MEMYQYFEGWMQRTGRRAVLLVDNLNLVFDGLPTEEQHQLRAVLMQNGAPVLVGASANIIEDTVQYAAPFYDAFQMHHLKKLSFEEALDVLSNLATITGNPVFHQNLAANRGQLAALYHLTGGSPRIMVRLYPLIQGGLSANVRTDLEGLMDTVTPEYKAIFEELPPQMRVILDAIALHWDPVTLETLRELTQLENTSLSPQLRRLEEVGWIVRKDAYRAKGSAYELGERFFNIWYLMRRSSRRQQKELLCLTKFLVTLYGDDLPKIGKTALKNAADHPDQISVHMALADGLKNKRMGQQLREKIYGELLNLATQDRANLADFDVPKEFIHKKERELFAAALDLLNKAKYQDALQKLTELTKIKPDNDHLNAALFAFYDQNIGLAKTALTEALQQTGGSLSPETQDDWWRFAAITAKLGQGRVVLEVLKPSGYDVMLRPYYVAIAAMLEKDSSAFLNSVAAEVREPALYILERIRKFE